MKKELSRKLVLVRETVVPLQGDQLAGVNGGESYSFGNRSFSYNDRSLSAGQSQGVGLSLRFTGKDYSIGFSG